MLARNEIRDQIHRPGPIKRDVITSYSIHYTKLYEYVNIASRCAGFLSRFFDGKLASPAPELNAGVLDVALQGAAEIEDEVRNAYEAREFGRALRLIMHRITSYNVCYTKLLRGDLGLDPVRRAPGDREGDARARRLRRDLRRSRFEPAPGPAPEIASLHENLGGVVITSYSIHYTKLYE